MKKSIVITSIFSPTKAVKEFSKKKDWQLVVVGDKKTPSDWSHDTVTYLSLEEQQLHFGEFAQKLPLNMYSRKNCC